MRTFIFLLCSTAFGFTSAEVFSQNTKIHIDKDQMVSIDEVFDLLRNQTDYTFIYEEDLFKDVPKVQLKKGTIRANKLLEICFSGKDFELDLKEDKIIIIAKEPSGTALQTFTVSGTVMDTDGQPLPGANIVEKGTTNGVTADFDGNFSINLNGDNAVLIVSYIGYATKEVVVNGQPIVNITLEESAAGLDEVVVVGYGTQKKSDITGATASLDKARLEQLPNNNVLQALHGSVPGLNISQTNGGAEGNNYNVQIRGRTSISASSSPLIVLDGVPYSGSFSDINPADIENVEVLKDASSSAIYGSRGANGVILITTKQGAYGKVSINYDGFVGINSIANVPNVLSGPEYAEWKRERLGFSTIEEALTLVSGGNPNSTEWVNFQNGVNTNWVDVISRNAYKQQHNLSISGGLEKIKYFISTSILNSEGVTLGDDFKRYTIRANIDAKINDYISVGSNTQLSRSDRSGQGPSFDSRLLSTLSPYRISPLTQPFSATNEQLVFVWPEQGQPNPLQGLLANDENISNKVFTKNYIEFTLPKIEGLKYQLNTGVTIENGRSDTYYGHNTARGVETKGFYNSVNFIREDYLVENILNYQRTFGDHSIGFTGLYSFQEKKFDRRALTANNFDSDILTFYQLGAAGTVSYDDSEGNFTKTALISQMARINYGFKGRYLLTLTGRRDGYSAFADNKKYGFFPSAAFGWNLSNEPFFENLKNTVSNLKLRLSYGANGNQAVSPYASESRLKQINPIQGNNIVTGFIPLVLGNSGLTWETTQSANIGLDYGLFKGIITGSIDYYNSLTKDLLLSRNIPSTNGFSQILQNVGEIKNSGVEFLINSTNIRTKNFWWGSSGNISFNNNEIVSLASNEDDIVNELFIGQPIDVNFGYIFGGVFQDQSQIDASAQKTAQVGDAIYLDVNGRDENGNLTGRPDGVIDANDRAIQGSLQPDFVYGLTNTINYKGLGLTIFIQGLQGIERPNDLYRDEVFENQANRNYFKFNYWSPDNPTNTRWANRPDANLLEANIYEDASFVRLKDVKLSYNLKEANLSKIDSFSNLTFYITGRNLVTLTKWKGLDPEFSSSFATPLQREFVFGVSLGF